LFGRLQVGGDHAIAGLRERFDINATNPTGGACHDHDVHLHRSAPRNMQFGEAAREEYWLAHMRTGARPQAWQALE